VRGRVIRKREGLTKATSHSREAKRSKVVDKGLNTDANREPRGSLLSREGEREKKRPPPSICLRRERKRRKT